MLRARQGRASIETEESFYSIASIEMVGDLPNFSSMVTLKSSLRAASKENFSGTNIGQNIVL